MTEILMRAPEELKAHPRNSEFFDDIEGENWLAFMDSIKQNGIIEPIVVDQNDVIISGHQRVRAAKELGMETVPVEQKFFPSEDDALMALLDTNVRQRGVLPNPVKLGRVFAEYKRLKGVKSGGDRRSEDFKSHNVTFETPESIAEKLGYSLTTLKYAEKVTTLPAEYQQLIENGTITASAGARLIASMDGDEQAALFEKLRNFPQAHFTNDDIEKFKEEMREETARTLAEMREDFREQLEEKEADIRAEYEGTLSDQEQTIERMKGEHSKKYDHLSELYRKLRDEYEKRVNELEEYEEKERERKKPSQEAYREFDTDGFAFGSICRDFIKTLAPYRYVVDRLREFDGKRQKDIVTSIKQVRDLMDSLIYVIKEGDTDERNDEQLQ